MIRAACILMVLSAPASAGDFRFADFGETCDHVVAPETAAGAVRIPPRLDSEGLIAFSARVFGKQTDVFYFCRDGKFSMGHYQTALEDAEQGLETFRSIYDYYNATYGVPALDNTPWQFGSTGTFPDEIRKNPNGYYVSWHTPRVMINALFARMEVPAEPAWRTLILVDSPPN